MNMHNMHTDEMVVRTAPACSASIHRERVNHWLFAFTVLLALLFSQDLLLAQPPRKEARSTGSDVATAEQLFAQRVLPLLKQKCFACHGNDPDDIRGEFTMLSREGLLRGGESGDAALVPGRPDDSPMYQAIRWDGLEMPPKANDRLTHREVDLVRRWIEAGAPWPADEAEPASPNGESTWADSDSSGIQIATSGGLSDDWTNRRYQPADVWAYQPLRRITPPAAAVGWSPHPIDRFIRRKLKSAGIAPADRASSAQLIRRLTFDLTGLPPTPEEVSTFAADNSQDAYDSLVQRLLASPEYGEQMARHWLDVVRYADTSGFSNDFERPSAWRYRDYVIRSFQNDKPFDQFIVEQIAGDELDPDDSEKTIAVGFLRMGPWEHTGMSVAAVTRQQFLDDVTHSVGVTFLGQGLRCARCHDHKFDPVPTRDYYRIQAVFAPVQFADRTVPLRDDENTDGRAEHEERVKRLLQETKALQDALLARKKERVAELLAEHGVKKVSELPESLRDSFAGLTEQEKSLNKMYTKRIAYFQRELNRFKPLALSVYSGPDNGYKSLTTVFPIPPHEKRKGEPATVRILAGGSLAAPLEPVTPGVLSAMAGSNDALQPTAWNTIPNRASGRRLAFARWVASQQNTLTARVLVNRVWQMHFGTGLVATPNNFGRMGAKPTHPELLDWLAVWFMDNGWSIKKLHQLIVTSETYKRLSDHPNAERIAQVDPDNHLLAYWPPRRLAAEELRDSLLAISGELSRQRGGPGVFPEINWEVALQPRHIMGAVAPAYQPSPRREQRNRRSIYAYRYRTLADPLLEVFNQPSSDISCERRDETTVTPQVFALLNSHFAQDRAIAMASHLEKLAETGAGRIRCAFLLAYGRAPSKEELKACLQHLVEMEDYHHEHAPVPVALPVVVEREMFEELTGETFTFTEELDVMRNYERDLKPWEVKPQTRALADICLVLMNSNEFVYVR